MWHFFLTFWLFQVFDIRLSIEVQFTNEAQTPDELGIEGMDSDSDDDDDDDEDSDQLVQIPLV